MSFGVNTTYGFGSSGSGGGGGGLSGGNEGLSVLGTTVQLGQLFGAGGDPAEITDEREIPLSASGRLRVVNPAGDMLLDLDAISEAALLGASDINYIKLQSGVSERVDFYFGLAARALSFDYVANHYSIGDVDSVNTGIIMSLDGGSNLATVDTALASAITLDGTNSVSKLGDANDITNGTKIVVDDSLQYVQALSTAGRMLSLDRLEQLYQVGDIDGFGNGATLEIIDYNSQLLFYDSLLASQSMNLSPNTGSYAIGDLNNIGGGNYLSINDAANEVRLGGAQSRFEIASDVAQITAGGTVLLDLNSVTGMYNVGDSLVGLSYLGIDGANGRVLMSNQNLIVFDSDTFTDKLILRTTGANGLLLSMDDASKRIVFENPLNPGGTKLNINGSDGYTGTVSNPTSITVEGGIITAIS